MLARMSLPALSSCGSPESPAWNEHQEGSRLRMAQRWSMKKIIVRPDMVLPSRKPLSAPSEQGQVGHSPKRQGPEVRHPSDDWLCKNSRDSSSKAAMQKSRLARALATGVRAGTAACGAQRVRERTWGSRAVGQVLRSRA